jgi:hypothetical protein
MSRAFKTASQAVQALMQLAERSGDQALQQETRVVARAIKGMARLERSFQAEGEQLSVSLMKLQKSLRAASAKTNSSRAFGSRAFGPRAFGPRGEQDGYYVQMVGRPRSSGSFRPADTGLIGRRVGRGPVRMGNAAANAQATKALNAVFSRLLAAQIELQQLRSEMERAKSKK